MHRIESITFNETRLAQQDQFTIFVTPKKRRLRFLCMKVEPDREEKNREEVTYER
jgi:hypothetical protein